MLAGPVLPARPCPYLFHLYLFKECAIRLNARSPYVLDTRELGRRPGMMRKVQRTVPAPAEMGTEVIGVRAGTDVELDLRLEAVMEGVLVSGTVSAVAVGECIRCLEEVRLELDVPIGELFSYPENRVPEDQDEDRQELEDDLINLEPVLRDAVVSELPFQPVCREDCPGLCSECGALLADDPDHKHEVSDPRWSALQGILSDGMQNAEDQVSGSPVPGGPDDMKES